MTVTESYDVTLSAANATMTDIETLITPSSPSACSSTIVPVDSNARGQAVATILATIEVTVTDTSSPSTTTFSTLDVPANQTNSMFGPGRGPAATTLVNTPGRPKPQNPGPAPENNSGSDNGAEGSENTPGELKPTVVESTIYAGVPYTSTVIVTKKTPVPVVPRSDQPPPVTFQQPPPPNGSPAANPNPNTQDRQPNNQNNQQQQPGGPNPGTQGGAPAAPSPTYNSAGFLETIIRSIIIQQPTSAPGRTPQTTINNVPIAVQPSSVIVGDSTVPIPTGRGEAVVTQSGAVFTIRPSEIVADTTTVAFGPLNPQGVISVAPTQVTAAPGVVVAVAGSTAVVDGTTFRLDASFSTVLTVSGERISIGPSGIGLPSTTIAIGQVTEVARLVETVGDVTFTIDGSEVFISGTRFGIGSDSPTITTSFGGERVSIGPGGVGFASTTITPTSAPTSTRSSGDTADSTSAGSADASVTADAADSGSDRLSVLNLPLYTVLCSLVTLVFAWST
jgi:hypothetical protein